MSKIIIGVHGLGNKPEKQLLERWWKLSIKEGLRRIGIYFLPFKFRLVYWADLIYDKPLVEGGEAPYKLIEKYIPAKCLYKNHSHKIRQKLLDVLEWNMDKVFLKKDLSIHYEGVSNTIIRKYFRELEVYYSETLKDKNGKDVLAKELIRLKLFKVLKKVKRKNIFVIGHSMGSIITYDVLTLLLPNQKIDTYATMGAPLGLPVIMAKNAVEQKAHGFSGEKLTTPPGVIHNWFNFSDLEDVIAMNYNLADDYNANRNGVSAIDYQITNDYQINGEINPHKSYGYLRTPEFAGSVYEFLLRDRTKLYVSIISFINKMISRFYKKEIS